MKALLGILVSFSICVIAFSGCIKHEEVLPPKVRVNPGPEDKYRAVIKIDGIDNYDDVSGESAHQIINAARCVPVDSRRSLGGSRPQFRHVTNNSVSEISEGNYEMVFYKDAILNEDYYGKGVCRWSSIPVYRFRWSGKYFIVAQSGSFEFGQEQLRVCKKDVVEYGSCIGIDYSENDYDDSNFYVRLTIYKE